MDPKPTPTEVVLAAIAVIAIALLLNKNGGPIKWFRKKNKDGSTSEKVTIGGKGTEKSPKEQQPTTSSFNTRAIYARKEVNCKTNVSRTIAADIDALPQTGNNFNHEIVVLNEATGSTFDGSSNIQLTGNKDVKDKATGSKSKFISKKEKSSDSEDTDSDEK